MSRLPTDEEFLVQLYEQFKDDEWIAIEERLTTSADAIAAARMYIAEGSFTDDQFDDLVDAIRESTSPTLYFRGDYINFLRQVALRAAGRHIDRLKDIPVGCLPTRLLNAAAFRTPRGGAVIVLDHGVIFHLGMLVRSYVAWRSWRAPDPYCRDHSQDNFARTILLLAHFSVSGDGKYLRDITTWRCPSLPMHDELVEGLALGIELFIMLHEFGHIALNHLARIRPVMLITQPSTELSIYTNSEKQEFEADEFAFRHYGTIRRRLDDVAFGCGLLFHFFNLCELISPSLPNEPRTHPPALQRWEKIKGYVDLSRYPGSWANYIDEEFAILGRCVS
jgi:hypothetical protein